VGVLFHFIHVYSYFGLVIFCQVCDFQFKFFLEVIDKDFRII